MSYQLEHVLPYFSVQTVLAVDAMDASNGSTECQLPWPGRESGRGTRPWFMPFQAWSPNGTAPFLALHHVTKAGHKRAYRALCGGAGRDPLISTRPTGGTGASPLRTKGSAQIPRSRG